MSDRLPSDRREKIIEQQHGGDGAWWMGRSGRGAKWYGRRERAVLMHGASGNEVQGRLDGNYCSNGHPFPGFFQITGKCLNDDISNEISVNTTPQQYNIISWMGDRTVISRTSTLLDDYFPRRWPSDDHPRRIIPEEIHSKLHIYTHRTKVNSKNNNRWTFSTRRQKI